MIPRECKRLAEVDFPIAEVSKHSAREKSIRHGHPSTLHLWWARRPLAACRAMLLGLLLPDPCDKNCPKDFKKKARDLLPLIIGKVGPKDEDLRKSLLTFIADFANWDKSSHPTYLEVGRGLVKAAHGEETPLVVDPFAGGGSIPLEALRLGCEAFASDLNPVACLILKVMLEDIPRHGQELAEELRRVGKEIKEKAEKELAEFYPKDPDGATPIGYLWARTVRCESPNCGAEIPLMRSFWLCKKENRKRALRYKIVRPKGEPPRVEFEIFEPKADKEVSGGTVTRANATCLCCNMVLPPARVRAQLSDQRGGADVVFDAKRKRTGGARMLAVVTLQPGIQGRQYRLPTERDYQAICKARKRLTSILAEWERDGKKGICPVPDEPLPQERLKGNSGFRVLLYGMRTFGDIFTTRQKMALIALSETSKTANDQMLQILLALLIGKGADGNSSLCRWMDGYENPVNTFSRQALPIVWDFCESAPQSKARGVFLSATDAVCEVIQEVRAANIGQVQQADACESPLPNETVSIWFTDPPYYDAMAYADLSDFFFVWLKRMLPGHPLLRDPFDLANPLSPKKQEAIQDPWRQADNRPKDRHFYESAMAKAFTEGRRSLREDGIASVVFAHKTTEGWEALLSGLTKGGWTITGPWPIATEQAQRLVARDTAALATSVHLVCRPRPEDAGVGDWHEVLHGNKDKGLEGLSERVGDWMERLQSEGIRGADLVFACIGPALEIFSRYRSVETADGHEVELGEYLEKVWEVVGRTALEQVLGTTEAKARNGMAGAIEEDARLTALFLWTLQSTNGETSNGGADLPAKASAQAGDEEDQDATTRSKPKGLSLAFDIVRRFAQPLGIDLPKWEARIIETKKGVVRLMAVSERAKQLFGGDGVESSVEELFSTSSTGQLVFPGLEDLASQRKQKPRGRGQKIRIEDPGEMDASATTLDRVHGAMLLQSGGQANALRALIKAEQDRGPEFLRLANALSALYPKGSEEKRLLDAMLLAVPR